MSNEIQNLLIPLANGENLTREQSLRAFQILFNGGATPAQIGALLMGLRQKGETTEELTGAAIIMRQKAIAFRAPANAIDTCGTGGDAKGTLNISTATAITAAACGVPVAKHGNKAITSSSGSADVLSELGIDILAPQAVMEQALEECGLAFIMAGRYHPGMRHIAPVRLELGLRSIFNLLGPLCNPAKPKRQMIGVFAPEWLMPMAETLRELGSERAFIVHGAGGMDEISLAGPSHIVELHNGEIQSFEITPEEAGLSPAPLEALRGGSPQENAMAMMRLLAGAEGPYLDVVLLNTALCLILAEKCDSLKDGVTLARTAITSGKAKETLARLAYITKPPAEGQHG